MQKKIRQDLNQAIKEREELKTSVLRMLLAEIQNREKEKRYKEKLSEEASLSDDELIAVISSEAKKRREAMEILDAVRAEKEKKELEILLDYLPEQLTDDEIISLIRESGQTEIGKIMAQVMPKVKGRADGSRVGRLAKEFLL